MKRQMLVLILGLACSVSYGQSILFEDDFESGMGHWVGKNSGSYSGYTLADPLGSGNLVLSFSSITACGDIFGPIFTVSPGYQYLLKFDYLGLARSGSQSTGFGGAIGVSDNLGCGNLWMAVTHHYDTVRLVDDGQWREYVVPFSLDDLQAVGMSGTVVRITIEDWNSGGLSLPAGVPGDVYFDNVQVVGYDPVENEESSFGRVKSLFR